MTDKYDYVVLSLGYTKFVVPRKAAFALFDLFQGKELYKYDTEYEKNKSHVLIKELEEAHYPEITALSPVTFHMGLQRWRDKEAAKEAEQQKSA